MSTSKICPICESAKLKNLGEKNLFEITRCNDCHTIFTTKIGAFEGDYDYTDYYRGENLITPEFVYETYRNVIKGVESYRLNNRLLDVGCGAGALLEIAGEMNWEAVGIEISNSATEFVKSRKLNVFEGTLKQAAFPDDHFDVITCTEVLEHVTDSKELIYEMSRILSPKGVLWITTPNSCGISGKLLGSNWRDIHPPEHLTLFSTKSLKMCLEEVGFKKFHFVSSGVNPFDIYKQLYEFDLGTIEKFD